MPDDAAPPVIRTVAAMRQQLAGARHAGHRIGFVPTMGALHEGHLSLARRARSECDVVVCSIFVNPTQFNDARDLAAYPRTLHDDVARLGAVGVHFVFAPGDSEIYPEGFSTTVDAGAIAEPLEGATRGTAHFRGVATVVTKLFGIVQPDAAYFGQKDAQQLLVIRRVVRDLDLPVEIIACDTVREADGLAMSSRNTRLDAPSRAQALGIPRALFAMEAAITAGTHDVRALRRIGVDVLASHGISGDAIDYLAVVDADSLDEPGTVTGRALLAIAAHVGGVRLIDNVVVRPS